ncbi:hypothetical protein P2W68_07415 [Chryseobacterium arthrosphaerae]|nr:hypothetical protein [Chryseobacterium arthrosphaerae]WES99437.1 hypothetical protein P2W68_07415 [Chryseobacterium arthrosphaerae]
MVRTTKGILAGLSGKVGTIIRAICTERISSEVCQNQQQPIQ